jgi:molybdate transport system substrate-binding protein
MLSNLYRLLLVTCGLLVPLCSQADTLIVSAASSLTNAFNEIGKAFEQAHPGTRVLLNYAASDTLLQQIAKGAPADVFASADQESMDKADTQNLIVSATRSNFARNTLVLTVPIESNVSLTSFQDLTRPTIARIAIGKSETVPAGRYAKQALDAANLWGTLAEKFIYTQSVRQALDYVNRAEVDAGFVYRTDAKIMGDKVKIAFEVSLATPILYPIAVVEDSGQTKLAKEFISFVSSEAGQNILNSHGFTRPE